ncbi:MAG: hypothetical protein ACK4XK_07410, partial [Casimicrobiaceae bacterium]
SAAGRASGMTLSALIPWAEAFGTEADPTVNSPSAGASAAEEAEFTPPTASLMRISDATQTGLEFVPRPEHGSQGRLALRAAADSTDADSSPGATEARVERALGVVGHRLLEVLARRPMDATGHMPPVDVEAVSALLVREGVPADEACPLAQRLIDHLDRLSRESPHWAFVFSPDHLEAGSEVNLVHAGVALRVDRTFVTRDGERWIIDFKFGEPPSGVDLDSWLASWTQSHQAQLERYRQAFLALDKRSVRAAVYAIWLDQLLPMSWT